MFTPLLRRLTALLGMLLAAALIALAIRHGGSGEALSAGRLGLSALYSSAGLACFAVSAALFSNLGLRILLAPGAGRMPLLAIAGVAVGTVGVSHLAERAIEAAGLVEGSLLEVLEASLRDARGPELALAVIGVGLAPALGEELLFRGVLLRGIARRWGPAAALVSTSLLFGLAHGDLAQGVGAGVLGAYLGAVALVSGSLWPAVVCHAVNNLCGVLFAGVSAPPWVDGIALLAAGGGVALLLRSR